MTDIEHTLKTAPCGLGCHCAVTFTKERNRFVADAQIKAVQRSPR